MFARKLNLKLKPNAMPEFQRALETNVLPLLRKQPGFKDELTFMVPGGNELFAISLWEKKELMDIYVKETYPQVNKVLEKMMEGAPEVKTFEVATSTFHKIGVGATA